MPVRDLKGQRFGRLKVLAEAESGDGSHTYRLCQCACGNQIVVRGTRLTQDAGPGKTVSCGCARADPFVS